MAVLAVGAEAAALVATPEAPARPRPACRASDRATPERAACARTRGRAGTSRCSHASLADHEAPATEAAALGGAARGAPTSARSSHGWASTSVPRGSSEPKASGSNEPSGPPHAQVALPGRHDDARAQERPVGRVGVPARLGVGTGIRIARAGGAWVWPGIRRRDGGEGPIGPSGGALLAGRHKSVVVGRPVSEPGHRRGHGPRRIGLAERPQRGVRAVGTGHSVLEEIAGGLVVGVDRAAEHGTGLGYLRCRLPRHNGPIVAAPPKHPLRKQAAIPQSEKPLAGWGALMDIRIGTRRAALERTFVRHAR